MSDNFALHQIRGRLSTSARAHRWLTTVGISEKEAYTFPLQREEQRAWLAQHHVESGELTWNKGFTCDMARDVFRECSIGQKTFQRARIIYDETDQPYPLGAEKSLVQLAKEFNQIRDDELLNDVQKDIVANIDDVSVGIALAKRVRKAVEEIRRKDRLAANIVLVGTLYDSALAEAEKQHRAMTCPDDPAVNGLLQKLFQAREDGEMGALRELLTDQEWSHCLGFFELPATTTTEMFCRAFDEHVSAATETMFVEC